MFNRKSSAEPTPLPVQPQPYDKPHAPETVIGAGSSFKGILKSEGTIRIDGTVEGEIESAGAVILSKTAKVLASISAHDVQVGGMIKGNISAANRVEIMKEGRVWGDISAGKLQVDEGAFFRGSSLMKNETPVPDQFLLDSPVTHSSNGAPVG